MDKICAVCGEPEWGIEHDPSDCTGYLAERKNQLIDALKEYADRENWTSATGVLGAEVSGWCGKGKGWDIADSAINETK